MNTENTPTPRTDAETWLTESKRLMVDALFAKELERENAALREALEHGLMLAYESERFIAIAKQSLNQYTK